MPTPFMCHECDSPTMNKSGICDKCEQAYTEGNKNIFATVRELEDRIKWYERAMNQIIVCCDLRDNFGMIEDIAKTALDGEPTTADEHNCMIQYNDPGDENVVRISDVNKEISKEWNRDREKKISMIKSIGYRGED